MALLPLIPVQNFELIRNKIVSVIGMEMGNQYVLDNTYPNVTKVWNERSTPIQLETECPTINVRLRKWKENNQTITKIQRSLIFDIEIYTTALATMSTPGDMTSALLMNKIAGMVSAILNYCDYNDLGMAGIVSETCIERYYVADKGDVADALSGMVGVIEYRVECIEYVMSPDRSVPINELTCTILLQDQTKGFFYDYRQQIISITSTSATLTNAFFSNPINEIDLIDSSNKILATYLLNTDYTQSGTTITATTFTFTNGTKILAKT